MALRNMAHVYRYMSTDDLEENVRRKRARLYTLYHHSPVSYGDMQEIRRAEFNLKQMEVELAARAAQLNLL